jgi:chromosome segregation ATPase
MCLFGRTPGSRRPPASSTLPPMAAPEHDESFVEKLSRQGEEALGRVAEELIANPVVNGAITRAFEAREKAVQAQEAAMGALNLPSAADIERVTRRLRSLSQRLEGIEDAIDRLEERLAAVDAGSSHAGIEQRLDEIGRDLAALRESVSPSGNPMPRAQERLTVSES